MCQIAIDIPNEVLFDTKMSKEEANQFARRAVALGYYTQSGVSIGYCAQIAGMTEEEFIKYLVLHPDRNYSFALYGSCQCKAKFRRRCGASSRNFNAAMVRSRQSKTVISGRMEY